MEDWQPLITVITFVLGGLFTLWLAERQAKHQMNRDRHAVEEARKDRSRELQRETLLALQEALATYGSAASETYSACRRKAEQAGDWSLDFDAIKEEQKAQFEVSRLVDRVKDDQLRPLWHPLMGHVNAMLESKSQKDADLAWVRWLEMWGPLHDRLRVLLQEHL